MTEPSESSGADASVPRARRLLWWDHGLGLLLAAAAIAALMLTMDLGFTRDEGYYFKAGQLYLGWFKDLFDNLSAGGLGDSFTQANIDKHWGYNPEHPVLVKALFGLSYWIFYEGLGWMAPGTAMRFAATWFAGGLVYLVYCAGAEMFGRVQGVVAAVATVAMPRPFFHAHLACFDYPMTMVWFGVLYAWWKGLRSTGWAWMVGVGVGIGLSTKLNAFFLPFVMGLHWLILRWHQVRLERVAGRVNLRLPPLPVAFLAMATVGPLVWYMLWPRHWYDTFNRVVWYMKFHMEHVHYFQYFFGQNLYEPPFPVSFPFTMSLVTMPEVTLAATVVGMLMLALAWLRQHPSPLPWDPLAKLRTAARDRLGGPLPLDPRGTGWWLWLGGLIPFAIIAMPSSPIFGGIKHWMPAMPFMALVAAYAMVEGGRAIAARVAPGQDRARLRQGLVVALLALMLLPAITATVHNHGYGTAFYNTLIGGTRGAADAHMMRQFWGYSSIHILDDLNANVSPNGQVFFQNTNWDSYAMYKRHKLLRDDIRYSPMPSGAYGMIHHQMAARSLELEIWKTYATRNPAFVGTYDGVPVISVYPNVKRYPKVRERHHGERATPKRDPKKAKPTQP